MHHKAVEKNSFRRSTDFKEQCGLTSLDKIFINGHLKN